MTFFTRHLPFTRFSSFFISQERADAHPFSGILIYWDGLPQSVFHLFFRFGQIWIAEPAPETHFWLQALFSTPGRWNRSPGQILSPYMAALW
jgi:hypothetical protein